MEDIRKNIVALLKRAAERLRETKLLDEYATQLDQCAGQIYQPCVVAVVGPVNAGKSTFINAFLNEDLATVGTNETTATINYFCYGDHSTSSSARCFWRDGKVDIVNLTFVHSLQGNDLDTLRRADGIDHLEYLVLNPYLQQVTLVDTPGTGAVLDEHEYRTAEFIHLERLLRDRHNQETQKIGSNADAVVYLISSIARSSDRDLLEEFKRVTQGKSRAFNAIGVMAKIDLYPDVMKRRKELAMKAANQLKESLNTVVPVSAGIRRALDHLLENDKAGLHRLINAVRCIPPLVLQKLLSSVDLYLESTPPGCSISPELRADLLGNMEWTVFTTIARMAADLSLDTDKIVKELSAIAGFDQLKEVLEQHIFRRSQILRCHRVLSDARQVLNRIKFQYLPKLRERDRADKAREDNFLAFIRQTLDNPSVAKEIDGLVLNNLFDRAKRVEALINAIERDFDIIFHQLDQYNMDFEVLCQVLDHSHLFTSQEANELQTLFGMYGLDLEKRLPLDEVTFNYAKKRQISWRKISVEDNNSIRRNVAQRAVSRYGFILNEILERTSQIEIN